MHIFQYRYAILSNNTFEILQSVHAERFKQITDRRQQRQEEHAKLFRAAVIENETATLNAKLDREASRKKHLDSIIYGKELLQQVESLNSKKVIIV